jgi:hypothetical protein
MFALNELRIDYTGGQGTCVVEDYDHVIIYINTSGSKSTMN